MIFCFTELLLAMAGAQVLRGMYMLRPDSQPGLSLKSGPDQRTRTV